MATAFTQSTSESLLPVRVISKESVENSVTKLEKRFDEVKNAIKECLERRNISVKKVADVLISLSADCHEQHKLFLKNNVTALCTALDHSELFEAKNIHWNYLDPCLLDPLVRKLELKEVRPQIEAYNLDLQQLRLKTPLALFCQTQKSKIVEPPQGFEEVAVEFTWPQDEGVTLEVVEQFRQEYAYQLNLHDFAMTLAEVRPGSYIVTWFVPKSIVEKLEVKIPNVILKEYCATKLTIAGTCVYCCHKMEEALDDASPSSCSLCSTPKSGDVNEPASPERNAAAQDSSQVPHRTSGNAVLDNLIPEDCFLEEYDCPVLYHLMERPHITSCCGNNISEEAVTRWQKYGTSCPLCRKADWSSVLNEDLQRRMQTVRMSCPFVDKVCQWEGSLFEYRPHLQSCYRNTELEQAGSVPKRAGLLYDAAQRGDVETVQRLSTSVDINSKNIMTGETALHLASKKGHVEVVRVLVEANADLNILDKVQEHSANT
jgi:hypothetical protein